MDATIEVDRDHKLRMRGIAADGAAIRHVRWLAGLTQEQLAALAGVDVKTVRNAERGQRVDLATLTRISFALNVDVSKLTIATRLPLELELRRREAVERWRHAWDVRDMEALLSIYDDNAVLHLPGAPDIPFAGEHRGRETLRRVHEICWSTCATEPTLDGDFSLLVSDNMVILREKKGFRLPDGHTEKLWCLQIFTFLPDTELVVDQRVEYDTLNFARLFQLPPQPSRPRRRRRGRQDSESSR
jgi:transcriptional regulator with XRE-family HTH domain